VRCNIATRTLAVVLVQPVAKSVEPLTKPSAVDSPVELAPVPEHEAQQRRQVWAVPVVIHPAFAETNVSPAQCSVKNQPSLQMQHRVEESGVLGPEIQAMTFRGNQP